MTEIIKKARILICEDEIIIATDLQSRLESFGHTICGKTNTALEALELVERHRPDLVLMDIVLHGEMDGIDAAEVIRGKWKVPVVFLTAYADTNRLERAKLAYPFGYVVKPFQDRDIRITVEMALYVAQVDAERRKSEEDLKKYKQIVSSNQSPTLYIDEHYRYRIVNDAYERFSDKKRQDLIGLTIAEFLGEDIFQMEIKEKFDRCLAGETVNFQHWIDFPSMGSRFVDVTYCPFINSNEQIDGVVSSIRDITDRKNAEEALRRSEQSVRKKLHAITDPEGDLGSLELSDVIDVEGVYSLMEDFYTLTQIGAALVDMRGKVLLATAWEDICLKFHRAHPETCQYCIESDTELGRDTHPGEFKLYRCKNNMWDMATPIVVGGRRLGNLLLGQFFFEDEVPDHELFEHQARKYGFVEAQYLDALDRVPRLSREYVLKSMSFLTKLAQMISNLSFSNLRLARTLAEKEALLKGFHQNEKKYRDLVEGANAIILDMDVTGRILHLNEWGLSFFGYDGDEIIGRNVCGTIVPELESGGRDLSMMLDEFNTHPDRFSDHENENIRKDGSRVRISWRNKARLDEQGKITGWLCIGREITDTTMPIKPIN